MKLLVGKLVRSGWTWFTLCGLTFTLATTVKEPAALAVMGFFFGAACVARTFMFCLTH